MSEELVVKDSNGNILKDGDSVIITKTLKVKGLSTPIKMGAKAKNIRLTDNPDEIDCRIDKVDLVIKTCYVKKG